MGDNTPAIATDVLEKNIASSDSEESVSLSDISTDTDGIQAVHESPRPSHHASGDQQTFARLTQSIQLTVTSLYRMQIRSPAPLDRLKDIPTEEFKSFQHFDVMHVREKFIALDKETTTSLGKMITRRRYLLRYRSSHQERLRDRKMSTQIGQSASIAGEGSTQQGHTPKDIAKAFDTSEAMDDRGSYKVGSELYSEATKKILDSAHQHTQPPELSALELPRTSGEDAASTTSDMASDFTRDSPIAIPPRPKDGKGAYKTSFECNYCKLPVYIHGENQRMWK